MSKKVNILSSKIKHDEREMKYIKKTQESLQIKEDKLEHNIGNNSENWGEGDNKDHVINVHPLIQHHSSPDTNF